MRTPQFLFWLGVATVVSLYVLYPLLERLAVGPMTTLYGEPPCTGTRWATRPLPRWRPIRYLLSGRFTYTAGSH